MQPTAPPEEPAPMAPMQVKEVFRTDLQGLYPQGMVETVVVQLTTEQVRAAGKQLRPLKRETAIAWLAELAILRESA